MDQRERIAVARKIWELTDMNSRIYEDVAELYADLKYNAPVYVASCWRVQLEGTSLTRFNTDLKTETLQCRFPTESKLFLWSLSL